MSISALLLPLILTSPLPDGGPAEISNTRTYPAASCSASEDNLVVDDFDGDGRDDVALIQNSCSGFTDTLSDRLLVYYQYDAASGQLVPTQSLFPSIERATQFRQPLLVPVPSIAGGRPRVASLSNGEVVLIGDWPPQVQARYTIGTSQESAAVADLEGDGSLELVVSGSAVGVYDLESGLREWAPELFGSEIQILQLDADPQLEIVTRGYVVQAWDGLTRQQQWVTQPLAGQWLTTARVGSPAIPSLLVDITEQDQQGQVHTRTSALSMLGVERWTLPCNGCIFRNPIAVEVSGGAPDELIGEGLDANYALRLEVRDATTGNVLRTGVPGTQSWSMVNLASGDFDGNGEADIVYMPFVGFQFRAERAASGEPFIAMETEIDPFLVTPWADLDGDGNEDFARASAGGMVQWTGDIRLVDAGVASMRWYRPHPPGDHVIRAMVSGQFDSDEEAELFVVLSYQASIVDASTGLTEGSKFSFPRPPTLAARWRALGETTDDIVAIYGGLFASESGIAVIDTDTRTESWHLPQSTVPGAEAALAMADVNGDGRVDALVSVGERCAAYDLQTRARLWIFNCHATAMAMRRSPTPEIAFVRTGGLVDFRRASDRTVLRTFDFGDEVTAIIAIPGDTDSMLIAVDGHLARVSAETGDVLAQSDYLGHRVGALGQLYARPRQGGSIDVRTASAIGVIDLRLQVGEPETFMDGFETGAPLRR